MKSLNMLQRCSGVLAGTLAMTIQWPTLTTAAEPAASTTDSFWATPAKPAAKPAPATEKETPPPPKEKPAQAAAPSASRIEALEKRVAELDTLLGEIKKAQPATSSAASWTTGYKDGGGGFYWMSPDQDFIYKLLGYAQINHQWTDARGAAIRAAGSKPVNNDFYIRRARLDFSATVYKNTELFMEIEGGAATSAPSATANQSDFALIEARITQKVVDAFQFRVGKFLVPFSNENSMRSSRALDTVERYAAINTMLAMPAIESQMGAMAFGDWAKKRYAYAFGVFNGNNKTADNYRDNNSQKELVGHFTWKPLAANSYPMSGMAFGVGMDWDRESTQPLDVKTLGGTKLSSLNVTGDRTGISGDMYFPIMKWLEVRGEGLFERFNDSRANLYGGFGQIVFNLWKTDKGAGFSPVARAESVVVSEHYGISLSRLNILTVGWNLSLNKNVVWRCNYIPSHFQYQGASAAYTANEGHYDEVLNQIQVKF